MKKSLSFIIVSVFIISFSILPTFAQVNKLHPDLQQVLSTKTDDDTVDICIWTKGYSPNATEMPSWPDIGAARKELNEYYDNWFKTKIEPVIFENIDYEEINIYQNIIIVRVKVKDVYSIVNHDIVSSVDYFENGIVENEAIEYGYIEQFFEHYPNSEQAFASNELLYDEIGELDVDVDDAIDYVIIFAHYAIAPDAMDSGVIGDRLIITPQLYAPFRFGYALYDVENDEFVPFSETIVDDYPFLPEYMDMYKIGTPFGDADCDQQLTIMDATKIQRILAQLDDYLRVNNEIHYYELEDICDVNRDGSLDIIDATVIQLKLADK